MSFERSCWARPRCSALAAVGRGAAAPPPARPRSRPGGYPDLEITGFARFRVPRRRHQRGAARRRRRANFSNELDFSQRHRGPCHRPRRASEETGLEYGATVEFEADTNRTDNTDETCRLPARRLGRGPPRRRGRPGRQQRRRRPHDRRRHRRHRRLGDRHLRRRADLQAARHGRRDQDPLLHARASAASSSASATRRSSTRSTAGRTTATRWRRTDGRRRELRRGGAGLQGRVRRHGRAGLAHRHRLRVERERRRHRRRRLRRRLRRRQRRPVRLQARRRPRHRGLRRQRARLLQRRRRRRAGAGEHLGQLRPARRQRQSWSTVPRSATALEPRLLGRRAAGRPAWCWPATRLLRQRRRTMPATDDDGWQAVGRLGLAF